MIMSCTCRTTTELFAASLALFAIVGFQLSLEAQMGEAETRTVPFIDSWDALQKKLIDECTHNGGLADFSIDTLRRSPTFRSIETGGGSDLWHSMLINEDGKYPIVALAGYHCIASRVPELKKVASMHVMMNASQPGSPVYAELLESISQQQYSSAELTALDAMMAAPVKCENVMLVASCLPREVLREWVEAGSGFEHGTPQAATLVTALLGEEGTTSGTKVEDIVNRYACIPGRARLVYVLYGDDDDADYQRCMNNVLANPGLSDTDIVVVLNVKRHYITANRKSLLSKLPEERAALIQRLLDREK